MYIEMSASNRRIEMIDLTQGDEPVITYRDPLGDIGSDALRRRGRPLENPILPENRTPNEANRSVRRRQSQTPASRRRQLESQRAFEGFGITKSPQTASNNPWINHVKAFAKKHNMSYWEALKSGKAKQSYVKGGTNIFNPVDGFKVGYKFGHDTLGPALFGKK